MQKNGHPLRSRKSESEHRAARSPAEEVEVPAVVCLCYDALVKWHSAETAPAQATIEHGLAIAIQFAAVHATLERKPAEVERLTLI
jgi:hypothetical protein